MELGLTFMPKAGSTRITPCAIALASSKGGTSKSTTVANLCVRAAQDSGAVVAIDLEPQQSLARWFELRRRTACSTTRACCRRATTRRPKRWRS